MRKLIVPASVAVLLGLVGVFLLPGAASASDSRPLQPPGAGYVYGIAPSSFPACLPPTEVPPLYSGGGWSGSDGSSRRAYTSTARWMSASGSNDVTIPVTIQYAEPCYNPVSLRLHTPAVVSRLEYGASPKTERSADVYMGHSTNAGIPGNFPGNSGAFRDYKITCAPAAWSQTATVYGDRYNATGARIVPINAPPGKSAATAFGFTLSGCAFVQALEVVHCVGMVENSPSQASCERVRWTAEQYFGQKRYPDSPDDGGVAIICGTVEKTFAWCAENYDRSAIDGTDFDQVCDPSRAPFFEWGTWDWLPAMISHYTRCMWVPINGWDASDRIGAAWRDGPGGQMVNPLANAVNAFKFNESCGPLVNGSVSALGETPVTVSTCDWAEWAGGYKIAIGIAAILAFAFWGANFIISTVSSVVMPKAPSFMKDDD